MERERAVTLEQLSKRRVSAFSKYSNGELFALLFEPAVAVGAEIAEYSDYSFYRNLSDQNAVTLMPSWQPLPSAKLDRRPLLDRDRSVDLACVRLRAHSHPALERFWALAQEMSATRLS
ncbi:hypothetical protein CVO77_02560 [Sphingopyxis lindanitolerans]|uniref:Uncharacterized protein n=1 Tax=Sphingopyxis lindanitolerans TaxID=2054227 RepID=A0A2S8B5F8_9SPHN|nr:hypothetical protein [Sphingopyxis lindanitolerans]PQM27489.1 hypothetical protein CVO77_02560 [Sphingopyxis lindanitolerans]